MPNRLMCFSYRRCTWPVIRQSSNQSAEFTRTHNNSKKSPMVAMKQSIGVAKIAKITKIHLNCVSMSQTFFRSSAYPSQKNLFHHNANENVCNFY